MCVFVPLVTSLINNVGGSVDIAPIANALTYVNGTLISEPTVLHHVCYRGDILSIISLLFVKLAMTSQVVFLCFQIKGLKSGIYFIGDREIF